MNGHIASDLSTAPAEARNPSRTIAVVGAWIARGVVALVAHVSQIASRKHKRGPRPTQPEVAEDLTLDQLRAALGDAGAMNCKVRFNSEGGFSLGRAVT